MPDTEQSPGNSEVQRHIEELANGGRATAVAARAAAPAQATQANFTIPGDVGTAAHARELTERLAKTRAAIGGLTTEIDKATIAMQALWSELERNRELLADLRRSEAMIQAGITEGQRPAFQRG